VVLVQSVSKLYKLYRIGMDVYGTNTRIEKTHLGSSGCGAQITGR
jgi:hypothetical protein